MTEENATETVGKVTPWILVALAVLAATGGIARIWLGEDLDQRLDSTTLQYFAVAGALLLLRHVKSLAFGDYKLEFRELARKVEKATVEAESAARSAGDALLFGTMPTQRTGGLEFEAGRAEVVPGPDPNDPWKGAFGDSVDNSLKRRLRGRVVNLPGREGWYTVELAVESTAPRTNPLRGNVQFFLHPTFVNDRPVVPVGPDGRATLSVAAWGAFTAGATTEDGARLELDLTALDTAPPEFRAR